MKKIKRLPIFIAFCCIITHCIPVEAETQEPVSFAPYVTSEMCTPEYWISRQPKPDRILMSSDEIAHLNTAIKSVPEANMYTLMNLEETFDGKALVNSMADFPSPIGLYLKGKPVPETYYKAIRDNIRKAEVSKKMKLRYGIVVNSTVIKEYPYFEYLSDDTADNEWDNFVYTSVPINEPLAVYFLTGDRKFAYVKSRIYAGWIPYEDIAMCKDKKEWENALDMDNFLVVTGEKIYLEASASDKDISEKKLPMGTVLPLEVNQTSVITSRMPWNNYVVKLPVRGEEGSFSQKLALIPVNRDVSIGYLPLTQENIISQAFKLLGNRYGWGGMLDSQDCSQFVRDIYLCFGLDIPRDVSQQYQMPVKKYDLTDLTSQEKASVMDNLLPGAILQFPGHEMLYLGKANGRYYTINDVSKLVNPLEEGKGVLRVRSVIVNELSIKRSNGKTWYDELNHIVIPWEHS